MGLQVIGLLSGQLKRTAEKIFLKRSGQSAMNTDTFISAFNLKIKDALSVYNYKSPAYSDESLM